MTWDKVSVLAALLGGDPVTWVRVSALATLLGGHCVMG